LGGGLEKLSADLFVYPAPVYRYTKTACRRFDLFGRRLFLFFARQANTTNNYGSNATQQTARGWLFIEARNPYTIRFHHGCNIRSTLDFVSSLIGRCLVGRRGQSEARQGWKTLQQSRCRSCGREQDWVRCLSNESF
jgi:hypothetical protein